MREDTKREDAGERDELDQPHIPEDVNRRSVLQGALVTAVSSPVGLESIAEVERLQGSTNNEQILEIIATEEGEVHYRFTVAGSVEKTETDETVGAGVNDAIVRGLNQDTTTVRGFTGNPGYGDAYAVEGEFRSFEQTGGTSDFELLLDGREVSPDVLGGPDETRDPPKRTVIERPVDGTLEIVSTEEAELYYDFSVEGAIEKTRIDETVKTEDNDTIITRADGVTQTVRGFTGNPGYGDAYDIDGTLKVFRQTSGSSDFFLRFDGERLTLEELARLNVEPAPDCVFDQFQRYSQRSPSYYSRLKSDLEESARNAEVIRAGSEAIMGSSRALKILARIHYGDYMGAADEFLQLLDQSARILLEESNHPLGRWLREYTGTARFVHGLLYDPENPIDEYIELVQDAAELQHERDLDSIGAALILAYRGYSGAISDDFRLMAVEIGELPLESAIAALKVNSHQQLLLKTFAESLMPLLDELARLTRFRTERTLTKQEMNKHFACKQAYWLEVYRLSSHINHLQQLGREESFFFEFANLVRRYLTQAFDNLSLGGDLVESSEQAAADAEQTYNRLLKDMVAFQEDANAC